MARISSKKSLKKVKPAVTPPTFDSNVEAGDLVLVNRAGGDFNTDVDDLAQYVGESLDIEQLVTDINTDINNVGGDLSDLKVRVEANEISIGNIEGHLGDANSDGTGDTITDRVINIEGSLGDNAAQIEANKDAIAINVGLIGDNTTEIGNNSDAIEALELDQARQNGWTGTPATGTNGGKTFKEQIEDNAAGIAALQGALVYRGPVADPAAAPPASPELGDFYQFTADGTVNAGWNAPSNTVSAGDYYAYYETPAGGKAWGAAGSNAVIIPGAGDGALTISAADNSGLSVLEGGTGFSANTASNVETKLAVKLDGKGGLDVGDDGIGIKVDGTVNDGKPGGSPSIIIDANGGGISVNPDFISGIAGPAPSLESVTTTGNTTSNGIISTADQSKSTFLHKDISQLPNITSA